MARRAEGWRLTLDARSGIYGVRWTDPRSHRRHHESTGARDLGEAQAEAARRYAEALSGRRRQAVGGGRSVARVDVGVAGADWLADVEHHLDPETIAKYGQYVASWAEHFGTLDRITAASIEDWWRARLRVAKRKTVIKAVYALTGDGRKAPGLLRWCVKRGLLDEVPACELPPPSTPGTPAPGRAVIETIPLSAAEVARLLAKLPELSVRGRKGGGGPWRVRDRFLVAWETALRPATLDELRAPGDYRRGARTLKIRDESDKARFGREVPLSPAARKALDRSTPDVGPIFGHADDHAAVDYLRAAAVAAKLPAEKAAKVKPYDLRHARLTLLAEHGNLVGVAFLAGHKAITTTNRYVHAHAKAAAEALATVSKGTGFGTGRGGTKRGGKG